MQAHNWDYQKIPTRDYHVYEHDRATLLECQDYDEEII